MNQFNNDIPYWDEKLTKKMYCKDSRGFNKKDESLKRDLEILSVAGVTLASILSETSVSSDELNTNALSDDFYPQGRLTVSEIDSSAGVVKRGMRFFVETNGVVAKASFFYFPKDFVLVHRDEVDDYKSEISEELESLVDVIVSRSDIELSTDAVILKRRILKFIEPK